MNERTNKRMNEHASQPCFFVAATPFPKGAALQYFSIILPGSNASRLKVDEHWTAQSEQGARDFI